MTDNTQVRLAQRPTGLPGDEVWDIATELLTSYHPGEGSPARFYAGLGFVPTGELDPAGEVILRLPLADLA